MMKYIERETARLFGKKILNSNVYEKDWQVHDISPVESSTSSFISTYTQVEVMDILLSDFGIHIQPEPYWCEDGQKWLVKIFKIVEKEGRSVLLRTLLPHENKYDAIESALLYVLEHVIMTREEARTIVLDLLYEEREKNGPDAIFVCSPQPGKNFWTVSEAIESVKNDVPLENGGTNTLIDNVLIDNVLMFHDYKLNQSDNNFYE